MFGRALIKLLSQVVPITQCLPLPGGENTPAGQRRSHDNIQNINTYNKKGYTVYQSI